MRLLILLIALIFLLGISFSHVFAVGGGGGGNGDGGSPGFTDVLCFDTGGIKFSMDPVQKFTVTRLSDGFVFEVEGIWRGKNFESGEVIFTEPGEYEFVSELGLRQNFTCPGFRFSCRIVELNATSCIKNESGVFAKFQMLNDDVVENLKFSYSLPDGTVLKYTTQSYSPALKDLKVVQKSQTRYLVTLPSDLNPNEFEVLHELCIGKNYVYSRIQCTEDGRGEPVVGAELKCGGPLNIEDRVACRLDLRGEQKNEYENFFPEECKSSSVDAEECLECYQNVQVCWSFPVGDERISCVKEQMSLGDFQEEKSKCNQLEENKKNNCLHELNHKIYNLIKFRFYDLEERVEEMYENGLIGKENLVNFVVSIELKKHAFNDATSKSERRQIILDVRELWRNLVSQVNVVGL